MYARHQRETPSSGVLSQFPVSFVVRPYRVTLPKFPDKKWAIHVSECNRDFSTKCEKDCWMAERTDFTKRLDMTTISRARVPSHFHVVRWRCVMRGSLFMLAILMVVPVLAQSPNPKTHQTITGCLTAPAAVMNTNSWTKRESRTSSIVQRFILIPMSESLSASSEINPRPRARIRERRNRCPTSRL